MTPERPQFDVRIACSFSADALADGVRAAFADQGISVRVDVSPYGQIVEELHGLHGRHDDTNLVVVIRPRDALRAPEGARDASPREERAAIARGDAWVGELFHGLIASGASARCRLHVAVLDDVEDGNEGDIGDDAEFNALSRWTKHVTSALRVAAGRGGAVLEQLPPIDVDPYLDELAHLPTTPAVLADLGRRLAHSVWRSRTPPTKVLVFDCDGTLWGGVCGELGPDGVDHSGRYRAVQRAAIEQRSAGRLLCIASHNAPDDVLAALAGDGPLGVEHLSATRVGWRPKSEMLIELAAELDLGLDSLVFIDDSPVQRQEVRSALPTVRVPEFATLFELVALFKRSWLFDIQRVTDEDRLRADHYHQERERRTQAEAAADREQFLRSLDVRVSAGGLSTPAAMDRAVQLVARTNQFAYVRRDFSSADLADSGPDRRRWILTVTDRIGDYGRVGVLADRLEGDSLHVEALLLSCRVLGRGVESCLVTLIAEDAQRLGARRVRMAVDRTERNEPLCRFVRTLGARDVGNRVVLDVPADALHDTPVSHARLVMEEASP